MIFEFFKFKKFDSTQCKTVWSIHFLTSKYKLLGYAKIISYIKKIYYSPSRQGEACKDKMYACKTPRSVSLHGVWLPAVLACALSDSTQCSPILGFPQFFQKINLWGLVSQRYSFFNKSLTPHSVSLRGVTYFANIPAKTNLSANLVKPIYG